MGAATHLRAAPTSLMGVSVGGLRHRIGETNLGLLGETLRVVQGQATSRLPVMSVVGTNRAVRPAVLVHGQAVVRL